MSLSSKLSQNRKINQLVYELLKIPFLCARSCNLLVSCMVYVLLSYHALHACYVCGCPFLRVASSIGNEFQNIQELGLPPSGIPT